MGLKLDRPLVVLDLESTGLNPRYDRIIEIGAIRLFPDGRQERFEQRVNPERPIPSPAAAVHGITDADVAQAPTFREIAGRLVSFLRNCDLAGFGIADYDLPMLTAEFARVGIVFGDWNMRVVDAKTIFHKREPRTLTAAYRFYCDKELVNAHSAIADVEATLAVIEGQIGRYPDLPAEVDKLDAFCNPPDRDAVDTGGRLRWVDDEVVIDFGQKKGLSLRELARSEPGYLQWVLRKDFAEDVKAIVEDALNGKFPVRPASSDDQ
jgi:DNA polymerase-3 subunit epsilon